MAWGRRLLLGIDVGARDIKVVVAQRGRGLPTLEYALLLPLPSSPEEGAQRIQAALEPLFATAHGPVQVSLAVPMVASTVKFLSLPNLSPVELRRVVEMEAQTQIPLPAEEVELDFHPLHLQADGTLRVLLAACRKDILRATMEPLEEMGAVVVQVQPSGIALYNAWAAGPGRQVNDEPLFLLEVGDQSSEMLLVNRGGNLALARSLALGEEHLLQALERDWDLGREAVEARLRSTGLRTNKGVEEMLSLCPHAQRWFEELGEEIVRSYQAFRVEQGEVVRRGELFGDLAQVEGFLEVLEERTSLSWGLGNPWVGYRKARPLEGQPHLFGVATGLALGPEGSRCSINLLPRDRLEAVFQRRAKQQAALALTASLLLSLAAFGWVRWSNQRYLEELKALQEQREQWKTYQLTGPMAALEQEVKRMKEVYAEAWDGADWLPLLRDLSARLPNQLWLDQISLHRRRQVILKGTALNHTALADALEMLRGMGRFTQIRLDNAHEGKVGEQTVVEFQITAQLPGPGRT